MTFTRNEVYATHLVFFSKEEISRFHIEILRMVRVGEKFFFNSLGTTKISPIFKLSVYIHVALLIKFPEQFELCFHFKYSRSYKALENLSHQSFETDFSITKYVTAATVVVGREYKNVL